MFFKRRSGDKARWRLVVVLEMIKAMCRMIMMWVTGRRMVIEGSGPERPVIPDNHDTASSPVMEQEEEEQEREEEAQSVEAERTREWDMPRTGMKLPVLPTTTGESITGFLAKRVVSADDIKAADRLVRKIGSLQGQVAELMWIVRPVIVALAMQKVQGRNRRDWRPWLLGLGME
ncbi:MAG: hypothetical protein Q9190_002529, partial [Brigantiaea leucoxantha]